MTHPAPSPPFTATGSPEPAPDFDTFARKHAEFLFRVAVALLRNHHDAEDAVQETLFKLYRTGGWQGLEDERAFLARAVWNTGLNRLGSASARAMRHAVQAEDLPLASAAPTPEQAVLAASDRDRMRTLIQALPEIFRQPLLLSAVEGMRSREVAAILDIPEATVRTRLLRARAELRRRWAEPLATQLPQEVRA